MTFFKVIPSAIRLLIRNFKSDVGLLKVCGWIEGMNGSRHELHEVGMVLWVTVILRLGLRVEREEGGDEWWMKLMGC